ncbi:MAG: SDR family oxidoreductase [Actinomycetota bacterium]
MSAQPEFAGKSAIVTGGSQGVGRAVVERLLAGGLERALIVGRDQAKGDAAAADLGDGVSFVSADLSSVEGVEAVLAAADDAFPVPHVLVNAAALSDRGSVWDTDAALWDRLLHTNVRAPGMLITGVAHRLRAAGSPGAVVTIGSVAAHGGSDFLYPYSTSKAALAALTRNAAYTLMRHRIRVNLVQPGWIDTPNEDRVQRELHDAPDDWLERASDRLPFGRLIDPAELARTVCFVASDAAGLMTGAVIDYDQSVRGAGEAPMPPPGQLLWGEPEEARP